MGGVRQGLLPALTALSVVALVGCLPGCKRCTGGDADDWLARIDSLTGDVQVAESDGERREAAKAQQQLFVGARLETGADGRAGLTLRRGGTLKVDPNSIVLIQEGETTEAEGGGAATSLLLEQGQLIGTGSEVEASALVIEVGGQRIRIGRSAQAKVVVPAGGDDRPRMFMILGSASVQTVGGEARDVVQGDVLELGSVGPVSSQADASVDASADASVDATIVTAETLVYTVELKRGRAQIKSLGDSRFKRIRRRRPTPIKLGTQLKLSSGAIVAVSSGEGQPQSELKGPAELLVREGSTRDDGQPSLAFESQSQQQTIALRGKRGQKGPDYLIQGVRLKTLVTHRQIDVRIKQEEKRALVAVRHGAVELAGSKRQKARLEAGQQAILTAGQIIGPKVPPEATLKLDKAGSVRVFVASRRVPVTFKWARPEDSSGALVEVSRSSSFSRPLFADVIRRNTLTLDLPRGQYHWRVRPRDKAGRLGPAVKGRIALLRDTSSQRLKDSKPPNNIIQESFGNTTVFYQNSLPNFTFRWRGVKGASRYTLKLFREGNLERPLRQAETRQPRARLRSGRIREGSYLWYVAARDSAGQLVETTKSRRLRIRYDNATPNLQIVRPRNGQVVTTDSVQARGATIRGSKVYINEVEATLDETYRFKHPVTLKAGPNDIIFRVVDKRAGSTLYLRRVVRR